MTKKEEFIAFINSNVNDTNKVQVVEMVLSSAESDSVNYFDAGHKTFNTDKDTLIDMLTIGFDDNLIGSLPNTTVVTHIFAWRVIPI